MPSERSTRTGGPRPLDRVGEGRSGNASGGILSGRGGPFRHDESHVPSLADFVSRHGRRGDGHS